MASTRPLVRARTTASAPTGGGTITRTELPGGLRVVTEAMPGMRSASVGVWVGVGSRDETPALAGTSHFLEHLLFKGTRTRSAADIAEAMDGVGGEFNAFTEKEHTCYYATVLDRDLPLAIDIVSDVVLDATVRSDDVEVERGVVLEEIAMRDDDPSDRVHDEFSEALFGPTPLGRPILGTVESINALTRAQINGLLPAALPAGRDDRRRGRQSRPRDGAASGAARVRADRLDRRPRQSRRPNGVDRRRRPVRWRCCKTTPSRPTSCSACTDCRGTTRAGSRSAC